MHGHSTSMATPIHGQCQGNSPKDREQWVDDVMKVSRMRARQLGTLRYMRTHTRTDILDGTCPFTSKS